MSLFVDDTLVYTENSKEFTNLLEIISKLGKVSQYKVIIQKSIIFTYKSNEHLEYNSLKRQFYQYSIINVQSLEGNLVKVMLDLYTKNHKNC